MLDVTRELIEALAVAIDPIVVAAMIHGPDKNGRVTVELDEYQWRATVEAATAVNVIMRRMKEREAYVPD